MPMLGGLGTALCAIVTRRQILPPVAPPAITAPVLTQTSADGDPLAFDVGIDETVSTGMYWHLQLASDAAFTQPLAGEQAVRDYVEMIYAADFSNGPQFPILANQPLGVVYARLRIERDDGVESNWSNVLTDEVTFIPATAPVLTQTSQDGKNPLAWSTQFFDLNQDDSDYVETRHRVDGGAWVVEDPVFVSSTWFTDHITNGVPRVLPKYSAAAPFPAGSTVEVQEGVTRGGVLEPVNVYVGDSITSPTISYAGKFDDEYPQFESYNEGVSGSNIADLENRLATTLGRRVVLNRRLSAVIFFL